MNEYLLRPWRAGDESALKAVWKAGFGDGDDYIDAFFAQFLKPGACLLAEADGAPVSAMYILDGAVLCPFRQKTLTASYTYALATLPAYRGRGIGAAVYRACCEAALSAGADAACVLPAEESLYPFYEKAAENRPVSALREIRYRRSDLPAPEFGQCARISVTEYAGLRESLLGGMPHAFLSESYLVWQAAQIEAFGGGLFLLNRGVAAAEMDGGTCVIRELLAPDADEVKAAAAVAAFCPAEDYIVRAPLFYDGPGERKRGMIGRFRTAPDFPYPDDLWWGFAFD